MLFASDKKDGYSCFSDRCAELIRLVPGEGLEPSRPLGDLRILSPLRLPFRHPGVAAYTECTERKSEIERHRDNQ